MTLPPPLLNFLKNAPLIPGVPHAPVVPSAATIVVAPAATVALASSQHQQQRLQPLAINIPEPSSMMTANMSSIGMKTPPHTPGGASRVMTVTDSEEVHIYVYPCSMYVCMYICTYVDTLLAIVFVLWL